MYRMFIRPSILNKTHHVKNFLMHNTITFGRNYCECTKRTIRNILKSYEIVDNKDIQFLKPVFRTRDWLRQRLTPIPYYRICRSRRPLGIKWWINSRLWLAPSSPVSSNCIYTHLQGSFIFLQGRQQIGTLIPPRIRKHHILAREQLAKPL